MARATPLTPMTGNTLLDVQDLTVQFKLPRGWVTALDRVSFQVKEGEIIGLVGESGSGKSQTLLAMMGLLASNGRAQGAVTFRGEQILNLTQANLDRLRGSEMAMIFQDPMTSLNPYLRISDQLCEPLMVHQGLGQKIAKAQAIAMLDRVRIPDARRRIDLYPHEFSGGMRQRVMIAMALLNKPSLLLADEPTTALDVTVQAQVLDLLAELAKDMGTAIIIVTHDLGVVARLANRVIVLYGGRIMEEGNADTLFATPLHPYTQGLIASMPRLDEPIHGELRVIKGQPRGLAETATPGCPFYARCELRIEYCRNVTPLLQTSTDARLACHRVDL